MSNAPKTRADCVDGPRPCPWISCRYHLGLPHESTKRGGSTNTCTLDLVVDGALPMAAIATELGVSIARIHQIETRALYKIRRAIIDLGLLEDTLELMADPGSHDRTTP